MDVLYLDEDISIVLHKTVSQHIKIESRQGIFYFLVNDKRFF